MEKKINQNSSKVIKAVLKELIIKHKYNINCNCEICVINTKIAKLRIELHNKNKTLDRYYTYAPILTVENIYSQISQLEKQIFNLKLEQQTIIYSNLNKINICHIT